MNEQRFDELAKALAATGTRRTFLRGLAGSLALALPGHPVLGAVQDAEECKRDGKNCKRNDQCCSGWCSPYSGACEVPGEIPFIGECTSNADCDDGDPCTYDVCGNISAMCFHDPIPGCQRCTGSGRCPHGGTCCDGRCCPEGSVCIPDPLGTGRDTCCDPCGDGLCCDVYASDYFAVRNCLEGCGACCNGGSGSCGVTEDGQLVMHCVQPGISR